MSKLRQAETVPVHPQSLDDVYRTQAPGLARYLRARFRGHHETEDMVQDIFARMAAGPAVTELRDPQSYLRRILRNYLIDRNRRSRSVPPVVPIDHVEPATAADQEHALEAAQMEQQYLAAVELLPPRTKQVFLMHRVEELAVKTIAERLELSTRTVEWHIAEAIVRIGKAVGRK